MPPKKLNKSAPAPAGGDLPTTDDLRAIAQNPSSSASTKLQQAATAADAALQNQKAASTLRSAAATMTDPAKRNKMLADAYNKEIEAHGNSKKARVLSSGAFQGGVGGAGIGAAVSAGLGTVVGTLVGGVTAIPATAVGGLVGAGTGLAHGPWIKLGKVGAGAEGKDGEKKEAGEERGVDPEDEDVVPDPEVLREAAGKMEKEGGKAGEKNGESATVKERKKPRKLEVRGKNKQTA